MPYPKEPAKHRHDLVGPSWPLPRGSLQDDGKYLRTAESVMNLLSDPSQEKPMHISYLYSWTVPPGQHPLSKTLWVVGYVSQTLPLVQLLTHQDGSVPNIAQATHECVVGVKRGDGSVRHLLRPEQRPPTDAYRSLMVKLREEDAAAIVGCDKYGRFGVLIPMPVEDYNAVVSDNYGKPEDYAGYSYVGNLDEIQQLLKDHPEACKVDQEDDVDDVDQVDEEGSPTWKPPDEADQEGSPTWKPPDEEVSTTNQHDAWQAPDSGSGERSPPSNPWDTNEEEDQSSGIGYGAAVGDNNNEEDPTGIGTWQPVAGVGRKRSRSETEENYHEDSGAAEADAFYSNLTRSLDTRADSWLFHMRSFNGWVKATQIAELDPRVQVQLRKKKGKALRVLDLACGKGGDLGKWSLHSRGIENYVGIDVARGSLKDAAIRARKMRNNKIPRCTFTCADLGADVPGRLKSRGKLGLQKLSTWSLQTEPVGSTGDPIFSKVAGGGILLDDKFDVISVQFAIHYMMSNIKRARRFFHTVSMLLDLGGNPICTTIDARVVIQQLMNLGQDLQFRESNEDDTDEPYIVKVGGGACQLKFEKEVVQRIFAPRSIKDSIPEEDLFGLKYTFTLVEGSDHSAGVGEAVDLPEWLAPIPALEQLAMEAGLEMEVAQNFHEYYNARKDPIVHHKAHNALYNMNVLNRSGSISEDEWGISRMYVAIKFRKVRDSLMVLVDGDSSSDEEEEEEEDTVSKHPPPQPVSEPGVLSSAKAQKMLPMAMMKAKKVYGSDAWNELESDEKKRLTTVELLKML